MIGKALMVGESVVIGGGVSNVIKEAEEIGGVILRDEMSRVCDGSRWMERKKAEWM